MKQGSFSTPDELYNFGNMVLFSDVLSSLAKPLRTLYTTWHPRGGNDTCTRLLQWLGIRIIASGSRLCQLCVACSVLITFKKGIGFTKDDIFYLIFLFYQSLSISPPLSLRRRTTQTTSLYSTLKDPEIMSLNQQLSIKTLL